MNDKYLHFEIEDFLVDDDFVNWALDGTNDGLWKEWLQQNNESQTQIEKAKIAIQQLRFNEPSSKVVDKAKQDIWQRIDHSTQTKTIKLQTSRRKWLYSIAAAAAIAVVAMMIIPERSITITSEMVNSENIILPAQSEIMLSSKSTISYDKKNWSQRRSVNLKGEAEFKVSKGVPFSVLTNNGSVEVLGTEFNVVSTGEIFQVKVTEGRVRASSDNHEKILTVGMAFYKNPSWEGEHALEEEWQSNEIYFAFDQRPLSEVLKALEFYTNLSIDTNGVDTSISYTGSFDTSEGIEMSLETVLWPVDINFEITSTSIQLSSRN